MDHVNSCKLPRAQTCASCFKLTCLCESGQCECGRYYCNNCCWDNTNELCTKCEIPTCDYCGKKTCACCQTALCSNCIYPGGYCEGCNEYFNHGM